MTLEEFKNKTILITGGTGSFGGMVLKKILNSEVKQIKIFSRDEKKQDDIRKKINSSKVKFYIGDVRDHEAINNSMQNVDLVFHAAALKQVPSCEFYPLEAVKTNVIGANNVMNAAIENNVSKVVVLSTDKAVYPINAMGLSKALMEKIAISKAPLCESKKTIFTITRYGNVIGSRGSVIPLFINQIKANKPITITDPNMTRFLMSLEEAFDLVVKAFSSAKQGDLFVKKSPACTISVLAQALKEIFNSDTSINFIGTRHGEKLYESLLSREEMAKAEDHQKYFKVSSDDRDLNYSKYFDEGKEEVSLSRDYNSHNTERLNVDEVKDLLTKLDIIKKELND